MNFQTKENSGEVIPTSTDSSDYCLPHYRTFLPPSILSFHFRVSVLTCTEFVKKYPVFQNFSAVMSFIWDSCAAQQNMGSFPYLDLEEVLKIDFRTKMARIH